MLRYRRAWKMLCDDIPTLCSFFSNSPHCISSSSPAVPLLLNQIVIDHQRLPNNLYANRMPSISLSQNQFRLLEKTEQSLHLLFFHRLPLSGRVLSYSLILDTTWRCFKRFTHTYAATWYHALTPRSTFHGCTLEMLWRLTNIYIKVVKCIPTILEGTAEHINKHENCMRRLILN